MTTTTMERRVWRGAELRMEGERRIVGYGAVFNRYSQNLGGYVEQVDPVAFNRTLEAADVMGLLNHDANMILGRTGAGTMRLTVDNIGLRYEIDAPDTSVARDLIVNIGLRNVTGSSFSFRTTRDGETWGTTEQGFPLRTLVDLELFDTGPVTYPAYLDTQEGANSVALRSLARSLELDPAEVAAAAQANDLRRLMDPDRSGAPTGPSIDTMRRRLQLAELEDPLRAR